MELRGSKVNIKYLLYTPNERWKSAGNLWKLLCSATEICALLIILVKIYISSMIYKIHSINNFIEPN